MVTGNRYAFDPSIPLPSVSYAVSRTGLVHRAACPLLEHVVVRGSRTEALAGGRRLALCCADGRIATPSPTPAEEPQGLARWQ